MGAILGVVGFILVLFVVGALMERNVKKAGIFGAALAVCSVLIIGLGDRPSSKVAGTDCYTEWDMRVSRTVCR